MFYHAYDIWSMATSSTFCMVSVDCAVLECGNGGFHKTRFVECVGMDEALNIEFVADSEAGIDGRWRRTPIFVKFETTCSSLDLLTES